VLEDEADVVGSEPVVDGDQHATRRRHPVVRLEEGRDVRGDDGHPVAVLQAGAPQGRGQPPDPLAELAIGVATILVHHGDLVGKHELAPLQEAERGQLAAVCASGVRGVVFTGHVVSPSR
jgi:hypothetical protein